MVKHSATTNPDPITREIVLERDHYRCVICGKPLEAGSIHHRRMRSHKWSGLNTLPNLILLCGSGDTGCHGYVHAHPREAYEKGWLVHSWVDKPETIPILTYMGWRLLTDIGYEKTTSIP